MEEENKNSKVCCAFCMKTEDEADLIDMASNLLRCGDEVIEFGDLLAEILFLKLNSGFICNFCQNEMAQFYCFKTSVQNNLNNHERNQRNEVFKKLNNFLDELDDSEELAVLRYNQCFTVVPESKRSLMQNFQSWQPRVNIKRSDQPNEKKFKAALINNHIEIEYTSELKDTDTETYEEYFVEECNDDYANDIDDQAYAASETVEIMHTTNEILSFNNKIKPSKSQLNWANETTKECYFLDKTDDGEIPSWCCCQCGRTYTSGQALRLHLLAKHLQNEIEPEEFSNDTGNDNQNHTATQFKNQNPLAVEKSAKKVNFNLNTFVQFEVAEELWNCQRCDTRYTSEKSLLLHLNEHEITFSAASKSTIPRPRKQRLLKHEWTCKECWFQFSAQRYFDSHLKLHETLRNMNPAIPLSRCEECNMFFKSDADLTSHIEGHSDGQSVLVPAEGIALQKTILFKRLAIPPEAQEGDSMCGHCGRKLDGEQNYKTHLLIHHISPLICSVDGREFKALQPYISHLQKAHSEMFPQSLGCRHCKATFDNIYERLAHNELCDEKMFHCDHCDKKFSNKNYLNNHLKREMGLLKCDCQLCGKVFKAKDELKTHMRTHTKEKPFKCSLCDKSYSTTSARASHMETHKDTVIQCDVCSVKFVARRHYIVHYKRFHDETYRQQKFDQLTCKICGKQFLRKDRLREHMIKAHNVKL